MSRIYLVRHGQAGTRKDYDALSEVGRRQARLLGEYFVAERICFSAAYAGALIRQQQTAAEVSAVYRDAGAGFPGIACEPAWDEFDLNHVYHALAPVLSAEDPSFALQYQELVAQARAAAEDPDAGVNRRWLPCDITIVKAWMQGRHPYSGESWEAFRQRVIGGRPKLGRNGPEESVVVFTSATPIGIWAALAMEIQDERAMRLAGVLHNTSCTVLRLDEGDDLRLHSFNAIPHLADPALRTFR